MKQSQWSSWLSFVLAAAGSAVGLRRHLEVPYVTAANGGGALPAGLSAVQLHPGVAVADGGRP